MNVKKPCSVWGVLFIHHFGRRDQHIFYTPFQRWVCYRPYITEEVFWFLNWLLKLNTINFIQGRTGRLYKPFFKQPDCCLWELFYYWNFCYWKKLHFLPENSYYLHQTWHYRKLNPLLAKWSWWWQTCNIKSKHFKHCSHHINNKCGWKQSLRKIMKFQSTQSKLISLLWTCPVNYTFHYTFYRKCGMKACRKARRFMKVYHSSQSNRQKWNCSARC